MVSSRGRNLLRRRWLEIVVLLLLLAGGSFFSQQSLAETRPFTLGTILGLTGQMAEWGEASRRGIEREVQAIRAEGGSIRFVLGDHQLKPQAAVTELQKQLASDQIDALFVEFSVAATALAPLTKSNQVVTLYSAAARSPLAESPWMVKSYQDFIQGCRAVALSWKGQGVNRVASLTSSHEPSQLCLDGIREVYPDVEVEELEFGEDPAVAVQRLKRKKIEGIFRAAYNPDFLQLLKYFEVFQYFPKVAAQSGIAPAPLLIERYPNLLPQMYFFDIDLSSGKGAPSPVAYEVAERLAQLHVRQLYQAFQKCGRDRECFFKALLASPPHPELGFEGFKDRVAVVRQKVVQIEPGGDLKQVGGR